MFDESLDKMRLFETYKLRNNPGFIAICEDLANKVQEVQKELNDANDPEDILPLHSQWKVYNNIYATLLSAPLMAMEEFQSAYGNIQDFLDNSEVQ
jgi:hypothetical protein